MGGSPVLVMLLSHCLLRTSDPFTKMKALASVLLVAGVLLTSNPFSIYGDAVRIYIFLFRVRKSTFAASPQMHGNVGVVVGIGLSLLSFFLSAFGAIFIKLASPYINKMHLAAYMGFAIFLISFVLSYADDAILRLEMHDSRDVTFRTWNSSFTMEVANEGRFPAATNMTCLVRISPLPFFEPNTDKN